MLSSFLCTACPANWEKRNREISQDRGYRCSRCSSYYICLISVPRPRWYLGALCPSTLPAVRFVAYCSLKSLCVRRHHSPLLWQPPRRAPPPLPISPLSFSSLRSSSISLPPRFSAHTTRRTTDRNRFGRTWSGPSTHSKTHTSTQAPHLKETKLGSPVLL